MEVLAVTIFLSLLLAVFFVVLFLGNHRTSRHSLEQEALLPLDDKRPMKPKNVLISPPDECRVTHE